MKKFKWPKYVAFYFISFTLLLCLVYLIFNKSNYTMEDNFTFLEPGGGLTSKITFTAPCTQMVLKYEGHNVDDFKQFVRIDMHTSDLNSHVDTNYPVDDPNVFYSNAPWVGGINRIFIQSKSNKVYSLDIYSIIPEIEYKEFEADCRPKEPDLKPFIETIINKVKKSY